jgi:hypothetical protein
MCEVAVVAYLKIPFQGPGLHIYIPWRLGGPVIPPGTEYPF